MSAGKAATITFAVCVAAWSLIFALMGVGTNEHRLLLAGSYTLIFAWLCTAYVYVMFDQTS